MGFQQADIANHEKFLESLYDLTQLIVVGSPQNQLNVNNCFTLENLKNNIPQVIADSNYLNCAKKNNWKLTLTENR